MELEQVRLDLLDLRQLYRLLQSCFSGQQNARVKILGGRARLLFKSLLDDATAKVFMAYPKIVETTGYERSSSLNKTMGNERSSSLNSYVSCPSTSHETTGYDLHCQRAKDISNTIKKIESNILALKLRSRSTNHIIESGLGRLSGVSELSPFRSDLLVNPVGQLSKNMSFTKANPTRGLSLSNDFGRFESVSRASQLHGCEQEVKRKATVGGIESLSQTANQASLPEFVHGFVVPSVPEDTGMKDLTRKTVRSHPSLYGSASGRSRAKEEEQRKNMPRQMVIRPTLLDHSTTELMVLPTPIKNRTDGATKRNNQMARARVVSRKKMNLQREEETEKSQSSTSASSSPSCASTASSSLSWTSQQSGVRSIDYSSPRHYVGPVDLHRVKASPTKRHKSDSHKGSEKMIGGLRRLKNNLGLILHHHHHHNGDDGQLTRVDRRQSTWKHARNIFHNAYKNLPVKESKKSRVKKAPSEDQVGHFHALAEGFMRHVWKPGRSKPSKGKIRGIRRRKKKKKTVKKLKCWKLPIKAKGFGNKKRRLKFA